MTTDQRLWSVFAAHALNGLLSDDSYPGWHQLSDGKCSYTSTAAGIADDMLREMRARFPRQPCQHSWVSITGSVFGSAKTIDYCEHCRITREVRR